MNPIADSDVNGESEAGARPTEGDPYAGLVDRIAAGDQQAFETLFRAVYDRLCVFAESYVGSSHAAEEIVDDVFLNFWRNRDRLRIRTSVLSYLFVAIRNKAFTQMRRAKLERHYAQRLETEQIRAVNVAGELEAQVVARELVGLVQQAVRELPPRTQQTYILYYQQHLSYAEIARIMEISVKTVENQLARALKLLWMRLKEQLT